MQLIPTGFLKKRFRMLKLKAERESFPPDSSDVFVPGLLQHYENRDSANARLTPQQREAVEKMPLAVFAACYR